MDERYKTYLIIIIGMAAMVYAFILWRRLKRSDTWPSTEGTIIHSDKIIVRHYFQKQTRVTIRYEYFAGCRYESESVKAGGPLHQRARDLDALPGKYPVGKIVPVYYDPNNPQVACLEKSGLDSVLMIGGYGCFAFISGLLLLVFA